MMDKTLNHPKGKLNYRFIDNGARERTIVFLHDSLGCVELWRDFPLQLGNITNSNILIYDRFGHGKSDPLIDPDRKRDYLDKEADILITILDQFEIQKAFLFGHSDGATIALLTAAKYPDRIAGLASEAAHIFVEEISIQGINEAVDLYETSDLKPRLEVYHGGKTDDLFRAWSDTWTSSEFRDWNMERRLPLIKSPVLIIQGEKDEYGSLRQVEVIKNNVSGRVESLVLPHIKHIPHREAADTVLKKTGEFIEFCFSKWQ